MAGRHVRMMRDVVLLLPRPALVRPPLAALVAAALAEAHPAAVAHRPPRDQIGRAHAWPPRCGALRDVVLLLPRPALVRPPLAALVAAALAEAHPAAVAHRPPRD